jgi:uncharacterized protein YdeI (YjbR/CyaY-like superfamily)
MDAFKTADDFYNAQQQWHEELNTLRELILSAGLKEEIKWGGPIYTHNGKNIVGLAGFKSYFGIWFYQGVFLEDKHKLLINAQEGTTKALRQMRFTSLKKDDLPIILSYVKEAILNQESGVEMKADRNKPILIPNELAKLFKENQTLEQCFSQFKKTQQREFAEYISTAKQDKTRQARLEKIIPMIAQGLGLNDKYRSKS